MHGHTLAGGATSGREPMAARPHRRRSSETPPRSRSCATRSATSRRSTRPATRTCRRSCSRARPAPARGSSPACSTRAARAPAVPFIDVNCAAIPETMLEAELFGFEAGAFTDAKRAKPGLFEAAAGGTLFLDEIDALPLALQGKLLKAIEEKSVRRLGRGRAAARRREADRGDAGGSARRWSRDGGFRADLYHRLAVVVLELPPLRARRDDVLALAEHFLARHARRRTALAPKRLDDGARRLAARRSRGPATCASSSHLMERVTLLGRERDVDAAMLERLRVPLPGPRRRARGPADGAPPPSDDEAVAHSRRARALRRQRRRRRAPPRPRPQRAPPPHAAPRHRAADPRRPGAHAAAAAVRERSRPLRRRGARRRQPSWEQKPVAVLAIDLVLPEGGVRAVDGRAALGGDDRGADRGLRRRVPRALAVAAERGLRHSARARAAPATGGAGGARDLAARSTTRSPRPELRHGGAPRHAARRRPSRAGRDRDRAAARRHARASPSACSATPAPARSWSRRRSRAASRRRASCAPRNVQLGADGAARVLASPVSGRVASAGDAAARQPTFVGRDRELGQLRESFESAAAGHGLVVFARRRRRASASRACSPSSASRSPASRISGSRDAAPPTAPRRRSSRSSTACGASSRSTTATTTASMRRQDRAGHRGARRRSRLDASRSCARCSGSRAARRRRRRARLGEPPERDLPRAEGAARAPRRSASPLVLVIEDLHWIDPGVGGVPRLPRRRRADDARSARLLASARLPAAVRRPQLPRAHRAAAAVGRRRSRPSRARCSAPPSCRRSCAR